MKSLASTVRRSAISLVLSTLAVAQQPAAPSKNAKGQAKPPAKAKNVAARPTLDFADFFPRVAQWTGKRPLLAFESLGEGRIVPRSWDVMQTFGGVIVELEAQFKGVGEPAEESEDFRRLTSLDLEVPPPGLEVRFRVNAKPHGVLDLPHSLIELPPGRVADYRHAPMLVAYASKRSESQWKALPAATNVRFRARVVGIEYWPLVGDIMFVYFTLLDAEPSRPRP
jgi:hypothetical protein